MIAGIALIVVAVVLFIIGTYIIGKTFKPSTIAVTLSPGENVTIGVASPGKVLTVYYSSSINKPLKISTNKSNIYYSEFLNAPLKVYNNESGFIVTTYRDGYYVIVFTMLNGTGALYLVNNYSMPITIKYSIANLMISSSILGGVLFLLSIVIGIVGVVLIILGLVLKSSK